MLGQAHIQPRDFPVHHIDVDRWQKVISEHSELSRVDTLEQIEPFTQMPQLRSVNHSAALTVGGQELGVFLWDKRGRILVEGNSSFLVPIAVALATELDAIVIDEAGDELEWIPRL